MTGRWKRCPERCDRGEVLDEDGQRARCPECGGLGEVWAEDEEPVIREPDSLGG